MVSQPEIRMVVHKDVHWHPVLQIFCHLCVGQQTAQSQSVRLILRHTAKCSYATLILAPQKRNDDAWF